MLANILIKAEIYHYNLLTVISFWLIMIIIIIILIFPS